VTSMLLCVNVWQSVGFIDMENGNLQVNPFQEGKGITGGMITNYINHTGLTKREMFAMAAMQGILSNGVDYTMYDDQDICKGAVVHADNLLAELEKTK
jgi:hypothetical protein